METPLLIVFLEHRSEEFVRDISGSIESLQSNSLICFNIKITVLKAPSQWPLSQVLLPPCQWWIIQYLAKHCWNSAVCKNGIWLGHSQSFSCLLLPSSLLTSSHDQGPICSSRYKRVSSLSQNHLERVFYSSLFIIILWEIKLFQVNSQDDLACRRFLPPPKTYDLEFNP